MRQSCVQQEQGAGQAAKPVLRGSIPAVWQQLTLHAPFPITALCLTPRLHQVSRSLDCEIALFSFVSPWGAVKQTQRRRRGAVPVLARVALPALLMEMFPCSNAVVEKQQTQPALYESQSNIWTHEKRIKLCPLRQLRAQQRSLPLLLMLCSLIPWDVLAGCVPHCDGDYYFKVVLYPQKWHYHRDWERWKKRAVLLTNAKTLQGRKSLSKLWISLLPGCQTCPEIQCCQFYPGRSMVSSSSSRSWAELGNKGRDGCPQAAANGILVSWVGERTWLQIAEDRINDLFLPNYLAV